MLVYLFYLVFLVACVLLFVLPIIGFSSSVLVSWPSILIFFLAILGCEWGLGYLGRRSQVSGIVIAFLSVLGCLATVLRFLPLPMGASAFFLIPILVGHIFGGVIGLLNAMLSMLMSGFWGGGLGPWTPYQIMASGLIGLISGMTVGRSKWSLAFVAFSMGILYGILMNIWAWPTLPDQNGSFVLFYVTTSLWWDVFRGVANSTLVIIFYEPITKILTRFKARFLTDLDINLSSLS